MQNKINPWAHRFADLLNKERIKELATVRVSPLEDLYSLPIELACAKLESLLDQTFYPTNQCVDILARLIGAADAHYRLTYSDIENFLMGIYDEDVPLKQFELPICLTGLAGIGKTSLLKAFLRVMGCEQYIELNQFHSPFVMATPKLITIGPRKSVNDLMKALTNSDAKNLNYVARFQSYRDSIPFIIADEFQFATSSSTANTIISQMLLSLCYVGVPWMFCANFSLLNKLQRRPVEEVERLLSNPIVLRPDSYNSECWMNTLGFQKEVAPEIIKIDAESDAKRIYIMTAGRKRATRRLICEAFRIVYPSKGLIDMPALERAYKSYEFSSYRKDSEIILNQMILNHPHKGRADLWCSLPMPKDAATQFFEDARAHRNDLVAEMELKSALTGPERKAAKEIQSNFKKNKNNVVTLGQNNKLNSQELINNAKKFRDSL